MKNINCASILLLVLITSCRQPKELVYRNVQNFRLQQGGTKPGEQHTSISADILLYNPNNYRMKLKNAQVDVFINGNAIGKMNVQEQISIPALDTFSLPVTINADLKNVISNALQLLFNSEVDVKLIGTIKAGRHGAFISIPVNYEGKLDIAAGLKW